ncbi:hypothetical protein [Planctomycetes bacterium CA13]|uniref:hypothetical protein n=1 Tax=Novipirellula herctigrandis TaxID=2527986 RepID=UPI0011B63227
MPRAKTLNHHWRFDAITVRLGMQEGFVASRAIAAGRNGRGKPFFTLDKCAVGRYGTFFM